MSPFSPACRVPSTRRSLKVSRLKASSGGYILAGRGGEASRCPELRLRGVGLLRIGAETLRRCRPDDVTKSVIHLVVNIYGHKKHLFPGRSEKIVLPAIDQFHEGTTKLAGGLTPRGWRERKLCLERDTWLLGAAFDLPFVQRASSPSRPECLSQSLIYLTVTGAKGRI